MQYAFPDLLGSSLIPVLAADVAAGSSCHVHFCLIGVMTVWTFPDQLAFLIRHDPDLSVITAHLTVIALGIKLRIHDIVVYEFHDIKHRLDIVLHIRHFHIAHRTAGRQCLEL